MNKLRELALSYILYTDHNIFLTGSAGTGKTTLLKEVLQKTSKDTVVVAPTGVAAINADGMTIHSFFQLPATTFAPVNQYINSDQITTWNILARNQKISKDKRRLFQELELLIIDEISMVRADLLDTIDYTLRRIRKNSKPFGDVQVLAIGDLFQLSPVVKQESWQHVQQYYDTPFFFSAQVWKKCVSAHIGLEKVYRQKDDIFISLLNRIRLGTKTQSDVDTLNSRHDAALSTEYVTTLTTHNSRARNINHLFLSKLKTKSTSLSASISGSFNESAFPTAEKITLKVGAQVMFVRNHPEGLYYNGKIGIIHSIGSEKLKVEFPQEKNIISVSKETWKNSRYKIDKETNEIELEEIGSFEQFPVRLAWAITVHKSQGLTFDHLSLDLENTFAPGQLYVALSRCRSLEGLSLSTKISLNNIMADQRVINFYSQLHAHADLEKKLDEAKQAYELKLINKSFDFIELRDIYNELFALLKSSDIVKKDALILKIKEQITILKRLIETGRKFCLQIEQLSLSIEENADLIGERLTKAIHYFSKELFDQHITFIKDLVGLKMDQSTKRKHMRLLTAIDDDIWVHINRLFKIRYKEKTLVIRASSFDRKNHPLKKKRIKGETYEKTLSLHKEGKNTKEIAKIRSLALGTIESHFSRLIAQSKVDIFDIMNEKNVSELRKEIQKHEEYNSSEIIEMFKGKYSYGELRCVQAFLELEKANQG